MTTFGQWLRVRRKKRGYSQRQLGPLAGTTGSNISRIEAGKHTPEADTVIALARILQESPQEALALATNYRFPSPDDSNLDAIIEIYSLLPEVERAILRRIVESLRPRDTVARMREVREEILRLSDLARQHMGQADYIAFVESVAGKAADLGFTQEDVQAMKKLASQQEQDA